MTYLLSLLMISSFGSAKVATCEVSSINGEKSDATLFYEPQKVLLSVVQENTEKTLIGEEDLYVIDTPALWFSREEDCNYNKTFLPDQSVKHNFICDADIKFTASLIISRFGGGRYKSTLTTPGLPVEENKILFKKCK